MSVREILLQQLRMLFRLKSSAFWLLFVLPVVYTLLFGMSYSKDIIKDIPLVIYDQDVTASSRAIVQAFTDSERYRVVGQVSSQQEMEQYLRDGFALAAIAIPPEFARNIKLGMGSEILVLANSTNIVFANAIISSSQEIIQTNIVGVSRQILQSINQLPDQALKIAYPVRLNVRIINNPTTSYNNFMLPGIQLNGVQIGIILTVLPLLLQEYGRLERRQVTAATLVTGKMLACWLCSSGITLVCLFLTICYFGVPMRGSFVELLLLCSAFCYLVINICLLLSAFFRDETMALQIPLIYFMPGLLFSGYSWPFLAMNDYSYAVSAMMPITYAAVPLRDIMLAGHAPALLKNVLGMFSAGCLFFLAAIYVFSLRRKKSL